METNEAAIYLASVTPSGFQLHEPQMIKIMYLLPRALLVDPPPVSPQHPHGSGDLPACPRRGSPRAEGRDPGVLAYPLGCCWHCLAPSLPPLTPLQTLAWRPSPGHTVGGAAQRGSFPEEEEEEKGGLGRGDVGNHQWERRWDPRRPLPPAGVAKLRP